MSVIDKRAGGRYASAQLFMGPDNPNMVSDEDKLRWRAYQLYDDIYHLRNDTFKVTIRGEDEEQKAIYLPTAKSAIGAIARFMSVDFGYDIVAGADPKTGQPLEPQEADAINLAYQIDKLFKREGFLNKFNSQKKYAMVRGDACWHIVGNDLKEDGKKLSIYQLHPGQYFPIYSPTIDDQLDGCHIVSEVPDPADPKKSVARRQTYRYLLDADGNKTGGVTSEITLWTIGKWDDRNPELKLESRGTELPLTPLDPRITVLPVYHIKNNSIDNDTFGRSEIAGYETIINARNQSITDEDMTLVMQGLGMFWTNAPPPEDENGNEAEWEVGPGSVIEVGEDQQFGRVTGVSSVAPFLEHINFLKDEMTQTMGIGDVAMGKVDTAIAESGISLALQLAPLLSLTGEKERDVKTVIDNMFFDLCTMWFPAYEGIDFHGSYIEAAFGDPMPKNRQAIIDETMQLIGATPPLITLDMAVDKMKELGWVYPANATEELYATMSRVAATLAGTVPGAEPELDENGNPIDPNAAPTDPSLEE